MKSRSGTVLQNGLLTSWNVGAVFPGRRNDTPFLLNNSKKWTVGAIKKQDLPIGEQLSPQIVAARLPTLVKAPATDSKKAS